MEYRLLRETRSTTLTQGGLHLIRHRRTVEILDGAESEGLIIPVRFGGRNTLENDSA